jgi:CRISPR system Cascade subunit CasE
MYFNRITLQADAQRSSDFWRIFQNPYTLHQSIWKLFGDYANRKRDFLYRLEQNKNHPLIYAVSAREPINMQDLWHIEAKSYEPKINLGTRLAFMLRANPIRAKRDENNKQHRHDVVMEAKSRLKEQVENKLVARIIQEEGFNWLSSRAEKCGFIVKPEDVLADGYQQHRFVKSKGGNIISLSTIEFNGTLTVVDPKLFLETLCQGIGPSKSFGCGLMLVKRI